MNDVDHAANHATNDGRQVRFFTGNSVHKHPLKQTTKLLMDYRRYQNIEKYCWLMICYSSSTMNSFYVIQYVFTRDVKNCLLHRLGFPLQGACENWAAEIT